MSEAIAPTVRARARAEMTEEIKRAARKRLAADGPDLSLRAVARDVGLVSSAVYRYFASRDELLTALIIDGYNSLGEAAEEAEAIAPRRYIPARWMALGRGIRHWALANRQEYALLYGSPVPGYAAPKDTIAPATRPLLVFTRLLRDGVDWGAIAQPVGDRIPRAVRTDLERISTIDGFGGLPLPVLARGLTAWAQLFGSVSFELFGRLQNAVEDYDAYFDHQLRAMAAYLGM